MNIFVIITQHGDWVYITVILHEWHVVYFGKLTLFSSLVRQTTKKTFKLCITGHVWVESNYGYHEFLPKRAIFQICMSNWFIRTPQSVNNLMTGCTNYEIQWLLKSFHVEIPICMFPRGVQVLKQSLSLFCIRCGVLDTCNIHMSILYIRCI